MKGVSIYPMTCEHIFKTRIINYENNIRIGIRSKFCL